jgi:hypothetical protein
VHPDTSLLGRAPLGRPCARPQTWVGAARALSPDVRLGRPGARCCGAASSVRRRREAWPPALVMAARALSPDVRFVWPGARCCGSASSVRRRREARPQTWVGAARCPVAGRSPRPSWPRLTACPLRFALQGFARSHSPAPRASGIPSRCALIGGMCVRCAVAGDARAHGPLKARSASEGMMRGSRTRR